MIVLLLIIAVSLAHGSTLDSSMSRSLFLPRELDPFQDDYLEAITRMSMEELNQLPKLADDELLDQLAQGVYSIPMSLARTKANNLFDTNYDEQLEYFPNIENEWEESMVGGPLSINYMSSVMAIASKKDFPFTTNFTYKLIKYPNSFRTTLVQVANDMHKALYGAHTTMDRIQGNLRQIPGLLKTALKLITQASPTMIKAMLPRTLTNIGQYANESATIGRLSLMRFETLQDLLQEIFEVTTMTESHNKETAAQLQVETEELKRNQSAVNDVLNRLKEEQQLARQNLENARKEYHEAMLSVPGGQWNTHAWQVYASNRPAYSCNGYWFWRRCSSNREQQLAEFSQAAKEKAEQALAFLKEAEEYSKQLFNQQIDKQNDIAIAINNLATINFAEISVNATIKVLLDAAQQLSKVQEQWSRITRFFSKLSIETENTQKVIMENFLGVIADAQSIGQPLSPIDQTLYVMMLVESATEIDRDSQQLFVMAKTYLDVSSEYLVDQVAGLAGFLYLQTDAERDSHLQSMASKTRTASSRVKDLATQRQRQYELVSYERQQQYMEYIEESTIQESLDLFGGIGIGKRR